MAEYKKVDLKSKIDTDFANNSTGAITAKVIRDDLKHIIDSIEPIVICTLIKPWILGIVEY